MTGDFKFDIFSRYINTETEIPSMPTSTFQHWDDPNLVGEAQLGSCGPWPLKEQTEPKSRTTGKT